jgi:Lrp/AsnC family transcriptional regulator, leucine-responsive regulatory protein
MEENFDLKDKKLIYSLVQDSRISRNVLAKKIGLSKNAVNYRINLLMKKGVIEKFTVLTNLASLELDTAVVKFKFEEDVYKIKGLLDYFVDHDFSIWVAVLSGEWDLVVEFVYKEQIQLSKIIEQIIEKWETSLHSYMIYPSNDSFRVEHLIEDFYKELKLEETNKDKIISKSPYKLDEVDKKILHSLSIDSGQSIVDIASNLKLSVDVVHYRIKQLIREGIIKKFYAELSSNELGYDLYVNFFKIRRMPLDVIKKFKDFLRNHKNITYAFFDINSGTFVFTCGFNSPERMELFLREIKDKFGRYNEKWDYYIIKKNLKFEMFPKGLLGS